jgi:hypothetical protein
MEQSGVMRASAVAHNLDWLSTIDSIFLYCATLIMDIENLIESFANDPKFIDKTINHLLTLEVHGKTLKRLKEACFFLSEMNKSYLESTNFHYHLSAFVLHARTVTWVMRKEYGKVPAWEQWYQSNAKVGVKGQSDFFKKITKMRNAAEKEGEMGEKFLFSFTISKDSIEKFMCGKNLRPEDFWKWSQDNCEGKTFDLRALKDGDEPNGLIGKISELRIEHDYFPNRNILNICKTYFFLLTKMVFECIENFGISPSFKGLLTNP